MKMAKFALDLCASDEMDKLDMAEFLPGNDCDNLKKIRRKTQKNFNIENPLVYICSGNTAEMLKLFLEYPIFRNKLLNHVSCSISKYF